MMLVPQYLELVVLLVHNKEIKEPLQFACINYTTVVLFIYGIGVVLSCEIYEGASMMLNDSSEDVCISYPMFLV